MIVTLSNFFYYLFTGVSGFFSSLTDIQSLFGNVLSVLNCFLFNFGGGSSTIEVLPSIDLFGVVSVVISFVFVISLALFVFRCAYRIFTLRF